MILPVPLYALVTEDGRKTARNGKSFWQNQLKTPVGIIKANIWDINNDAEQSPAVPHTGEIIAITAFKDDMAEHKSIAIREFSRVTKGDLPSEAKIITEIERAKPEDLKRAIDIICDGSFWENRKHYEFTMKCMGKLEADKLKISPAAIAVHHRYAGGLLIHTAEVLKMCRAIVECNKEYGFINRDVLYSSAIIHDLGKVYTYYINELGMACSHITEKTIGHLFYSTYLIESTYAENKDMVERIFIDEIMHSVGAHHGDPIFGSLKKVQSIEAGILSKIDWISARNGMVDSLLRDNARANQGLQESFTVYGDSYFASQGMKKYMENLEI